MRLRKRNEEEVKSPATPTENKMEVDIKIKKELDIKSIEGLTDEIETVTISDEEDGTFQTKRRVIYFIKIIFQRGEKC